MNNIAQQTVAALQQGGTILYPTDTIWGIGCDARLAAAVERLYAIKQRDRSKSMLVLVEASIVDLKLWPADADDRPTTYIMPEAMWRRLLKTPIASNLAADDGSLGIRMPRHRFCQQVIAQLGAPIVSTSANLSGQPSPTAYADIDAALKQRLDFCVPNMPCFGNSTGQGSRIVRLLPNGERQVLRQ